MVDNDIIAVVDDDPSMLKGIERLLKTFGYATVAFESAEQFLSEIEQHNPSCLVLDISLTGMSGIELGRQIADSGRQLPIIFMTAIQNEGIEAQALEIGCVAYLHKPFSGQHLIAAIKRCHSPN
jgi:FixJ family two-component response regulator